MIAVWILAVAGGFTVAVLASRVALVAAIGLAERTRLPRFIVGMTLLAIGTDLPEMANSIAASVSGHGDINVGDSIGSAATQVTLVLGLLPFLAGGVRSRGSGVALTGWASVVALGLVAVAVANGELSRLDGLLLVLTWIAASRLLWSRVSAAVPEARTRAGSASVGLGAKALLALAVVGAGAALAVKGIVEIAAALAVPELFISFFGASIGTSLPELVVSVSALRRDEADLALGDVFGSSLADSTLSIGIGPLIAPTVVTTSLALRGVFAAMGVMVVATVLMSLVETHDRRTGAALIAVYAALYLILI